MSKFDEFDLDLQAVKSNAIAGPASVPFTYAACDVTSDSIAHCTRNGQWVTCACSTCCTGYTFGQCSNDC